MDDLLAAFGESIAHGGPMYALAAWAVVRAWDDRRM